MDRSDYTITSLMVLVYFDDQITILHQNPFSYSEDTIFVIISDDRASSLEILPCMKTEITQQSMVIFSTVDSHFGIFEENGMTIVDLGTQFGIAGSGAMPDSIDVSSKYINESIPREAISPVSTHGDWQIPNVYFAQQAYQGIYTLDLVTNEEITYTFEFEVRQVVSSDVDESIVESTLEIENRELRERNAELQSRIDLMSLKIEDLTNIIMEQVKIIMDMIQNE